MAAGAIERRRLAALNNAAWCEAVSAAHGLPGRTTAAAWVQPRVGPPYYPNMVTLSPDGTEEQRAAIEGLKSALPGGFSLKDSFAALDLPRHDFRILFDAEWLWREPDARALPATDAWERITTEAGLAVWEAAWAEGGSPAAMQVFPPALLADERLAFFAIAAGGRIVAGCAANRSEGAVGLSNFFTLAGDVGRQRASAVAAVQAFAPGLPIAGYERDTEFLPDFAALGFLLAGPLRLWHWQEPAA